MHNEKPHYQDIAKWKVNIHILKNVISACDSCPKRHLKFIRFNHITMLMVCFLIGRKCKSQTNLVI